MTREDAKTLLPIIKAWSEGETIQFKMDTSGGWVDAVDVRFTKDATYYRIKPKRTIVRIFRNESGKLDVATSYIDTEPGTTWKWVSDPIELYPEDGQ